MKASSRPLPDWLKWVMRVVAVVLIAYAAFTVYVVSTALWVLAHSKQGLTASLMARSGMPLMETIGRLGLGAFLIFFGIWLLRRSVKKPAALPEADETKAVEATPIPVMPSKPAKRGPAKRWHSCNVLQAGAAGGQLWQFDARFALSRKHDAPAGEPLPGHLVKKSWRSLGQPKLNVAWLPPDLVFLRVVRLPQSNFDETLSMVELQLEKLSPIPVTQVVWSIHPLPGAADGLQTLIVVLAERKAVEEFLGQLEGQGYLADRLELSALDQLEATPITEDGAWIYPGAWGGQEAALVAWWYGGALQNLNFITLSATTNRPGSLKEQLTQMAWAGELEGWLTSPPAWHLVADESTAATWETMLRQGLAEPIVITAPLNAAALAALTAKRAARTEPQANLLPAEFATRYRQQFVDHLWMRGLAAIGALYAVGIAIYFGALSVQLFRVNRVESEVKGLSQTYTNAIQLKARYQVLTERQELKFAALDCWKAVAELLPETVTLDGFNLIDGRRLALNGSAPAGEVNAVLDFVKAMRKATVNGQLLFDQTKPEQFNSPRSANPATMGWNFSLELNRAEVR